MSEGREKESVCVCWGGMLQVREKESVCVCWGGMLQVREKEKEVTLSHF
jgi:hypothetical protein